MSAMTTDDIHPSVIVEIRTNSEPVMMDCREAGLCRGVRGLTLYNLGAVLGRLSITEGGQVYHSMLGSVPTWNREELEGQIAKAREQVANLTGALERL